MSRAASKQNPFETTEPLAPEGTPERTAQIVAGVEKLWGHLRRPDAAAPRLLLGEQESFNFEPPTEPEPAPEFGGYTFDPELDQDRIKAQLYRVLRLMQDAEWRTLFEIQSATGDPAQSISARLRDFRKEQFGSHTVNRRRRGEGRRGLFEYQLILNRTPHDPLTQNGDERHESPAAILERQNW